MSVILRPYRHFVYNRYHRCFTLLCQERNLIHNNVRPCLTMQQSKQQTPANFNKFSQTFLRRSYSGCCPGTISQGTYEYVCTETLESLSEYFEEVVEAAPEFKEADVTYGDGVLTVRLGPKFGTYVINRQAPNKQIWLSSPFSGPKRYDFAVIDEENGNDSRGFWVYKQEKLTLHQLLQNEIGEIVDSSIDFLSLPYALKN